MTTNAFYSEKREVGDDELDPDATIAAAVQNGLALDEVRERAALESYRTYSLFD